MFGRWEWILIELIVLGLAIAELISVRRSLKRDRERASARTSDSSDTPAD